MKPAVGRSSIARDAEKFGVRTPLSRPIEMGEVTVHEDRTALADLSPVVEAQNSAHLFTKAGSMHVVRLMPVQGSKDGRAVALEIEASGDHGRVDRLEDGDLRLKMQWS